MGTLQTFVRQNDTAALHIQHPAKLSPMIQDVLPSIICDVVFHADDDAAPVHWPKMLNGGGYRPHFVIGDPKQRKAKLSRPPKNFYGENTKSLSEVENYIDETMLGMAFLEGPNDPQLGEKFRVTVVPMFWPDEIYNELENAGTTFTIREGAKVVGFGRVAEWHAPESSPK